MTPRYTFRLRPERDNDLINWLNSLGEGERSFFIRQALRQALSGKINIPENQPILQSLKAENNPEKTVLMKEADNSKTDFLEISDRLNNLSKLF